MIFYWFSSSVKFVMEGRFPQIAIEDRRPQANEGTTCQRHAL